MTFKSTTSTSLLALALAVLIAWSTSTTATTTTTTTSTLPVGLSCIQNNQFMCATGETWAEGPITIGGSAPLVFEGATSNSFKTYFSVADPSSTHTITVPDFSTVLPVAGSCGSNTLMSSLSGTTGVFTCTTPSDLVCTNCVDSTDMNVLAGATPLQFGGATLDAFETSLAVTDPTADRTFTIPNADSVAVVPQTCGAGEGVTAVSAAGVLTCSATVASGAWDSLTSPSGNLVLSMNNDTTTFVWGNATGAGTAMLTLSDSALNTGTGPILRLSKGAASNAREFEISDATSTNGFIADSGPGIFQPIGLGALSATNLHADTSATLTVANGLNDPIDLTLGDQMYAFYKVDGPTGAFSIGGTTETVSHGRLLVLWNSTSQNMTVKHNYATAGGSKFFFMDGADHTTVGVGNMTFIYDESLSRWMEIAEQL